MAGQEGGGAFGAVLPALGLSNKAVFSPAEALERINPDSYVSEGPDLAPNAAPSVFPGKCRTRWLFLTVVVLPVLRRKSGSHWGKDCI